MERVKTLKSLSVDDLPSYEEELALDWTLSTDDIRFIAQSVKGDQQILYFAVKLKSLKNTGDFLSIHALPEKILYYLSKQLSIPPSSLITVSRNSEAQYHRKIKSYLGYHDFLEKEGKRPSTTVISPNPITC
jgi:uncharacterized protein DUF4158